MEDMLLLDAIERYLNGTMLPEEKTYFGQLRKNTPEIDQMVVEHKILLHQLDNYSEQSKLKHALHETHARLLERGNIHEGGNISAKGKVIRLWKKYSMATAIAVSVIAVVTAIGISVWVSYFSPAVNLSKNQLQQLSGDIEQIKKVQRDQDSKLKQLNAPVSTPVVRGPVVSSGTAFLIDPKGYLITNAHVLKGNDAVVANNRGQEFSAKIMEINQEKDLAILRIDDPDFKSFNSLPYGIRKANVELGEELFTLGYPRDEIVYNMGYLSARSGYHGDTSSCQITLSANRGNSGGPVFNRNGEIVGILTSRQTEAEGVVFAVKAKGIYDMVEELQNDSLAQKIKLPLYSSLKGQNRVNQINEVEDYVFLIKAYNTK